MSVSPDTQSTPNRPDTLARELCEQINVWDMFGASREPGVGCLHDNGSVPVRGAVCPCLRAGTSNADQ